MDRAQEGAATGAADGGGPLGEAGTSREAPGEGGAAAPSTAAADVADDGRHGDGVGRRRGRVEYL